MLPIPAAVETPVASVSIDDIQAVALPALRHRVLVNFEGEAEGVTPDKVVANIAETLPREAAGAAKAG
jgi:MoxR-like ATPase